MYKYYKAEKTWRQALKMNETATTKKCLIKRLREEGNIRKRFRKKIFLSNN